MNKLFTILLTIVLGVTTWNSASAQTNYGLQIAGVEVTSANASNLTVISGVSGDEVSYNHSDKTLKLKNATINKTGVNPIKNNNVTGLTIVLEGSNNLVSKGKYSSGLFTKSTEIKGSGSLNINSQYYGLFVGENSTLTIENTTVEIESTKWGIAGLHAASDRHLIIYNSTVKATGTEYGSITNLTSLTLSDSKITEPAEAAFDSSLNGIALNGSLVKTQVVIEPIVRYGLVIAGSTYVTELNASDLTVIDGVSGDEVSYNPSNKTLKLKNATINKAGADPITNQNITGLIIALEGSNNLSGDNVFHSNTKITGSGSLKVNTSNIGLYVRPSTTLTIEDTTVEVEAGNWGIAGQDGTSGDHLIINNSTVKATGTKHGSIMDLASLTLNDSKITAPAGAAFDSNLHGVALNGSLVKAQVVIEPAVRYGLRIAGANVTELNASDLTVINGVSGDEVSYNPSNKTLKLKNATINGAGVNAIRNDNVTDLIIALEGSNNLLSSNSFYKNTKITGGGSLKVNASNIGLYLRPSTTITIEDTTVEVETDNWGIAGYNGTSNENLIITNSTVKAIGTNHGSIMDLASLTLNDSKITTPAGAAFDSGLLGVALNGSLVKTQVVIEPDTSSVEDIASKAKISVYPNPVSDILYIKAEHAELAHSTVEIIDMMGKTVLQEELENGSISLNIKHLKQGVYMVKIGKAVKRIIKKYIL